MTRDTHLLPGHQIWGLTPGFAATFWTGFSFQKIFRERLFSGIADYRRDAYWPVCEEPSNVALIGLSFAISSTAQPIKKAGSSRRPHPPFFSGVTPQYPQLCGCKTQRLNRWAVDDGPITAKSQNWPRRAGDERIPAPQALIGEAFLPSRMPAREGCLHNET